VAGNAVGFWGESFGKTLKKKEKRLSVYFSAESVEKGRGHRDLMCKKEILLAKKLSVGTGSYVVENRLKRRVGGYRNGGKLTYP